MQKKDMLEPKYPRPESQSFRIPLTHVYEIRVLPSGATAVYLNSLLPIIIQSGELGVGSNEDEATNELFLYYQV